MDSYDWEMVGTIAVIILVIFAFMFVLILGINQAEKYSCKVTAEKAHLHYSFSFWTGCLVLDQGRWIDIDNRGNVNVVE